MTQEPTSSNRPDEALISVCDAQSANLAAKPDTRENDDSSSEPEYYDPAEYRWVPVRRRPRHDGWTEEKQRRFIETLADTGLVSHAARAVGMSRESANRLRRSAHGASFARAWDAARQHAGTALEDIAFERAIEGVEHNVYDEYGDVICTKRVYNDRLLTFLLRHLKPERYAPDVTGIASASSANLEMSLRAMEPQLPAPPEALMDAETFEEALDLADAADGILPTFLAEQSPDKVGQWLDRGHTEKGPHPRSIAFGLSSRDVPPPRRFR